jgi:hypothetical protein
MAYRGFDYETVRQVTQVVDESYLQHWVTILRDPPNRPGPERTARCIASHLLETGFSSDFLHRWWTQRIRHKQSAQDLAEMVEEAHSLTGQRPREHDVLVAFEGIPDEESGKPQGWLDARGVSAWLRQQTFDVSGVKQNGGMVMKVSALDAWAAVEIAAEKVDHLASRVAIGTNGQLSTTRKAWVAGQRQPFLLRRRRRGIEIRALHRENQLYSEGRGGIVDAAIELLAPLAASSPAPAVAGGWAAIEALLSAPGDTERILAADRLAVLVACSFPRAELTLLSYKIQELGGDVANRLAIYEENKTRAQVTAEAIKTGELETLPNESDRAALFRMQALLRNPGRVLLDIQDHVASVFHRLYRQRNLVLHGGKTDAVGLRASLRTAAPLVGAGMDRIAHASFVQGVGPLELAARARINMDLLASGGAPDVLSLLG